MRTVPWLALALVGLTTVASCGAAKDVVQAQPGSWPLSPTDLPIQFKQVSFPVHHAVQDMYFTGEVFLEPTVSFYVWSDGRGELRVNPNATAKVYNETELGNRLWLTYRLARQHLDYPQQHIARIRVVLDTGTFNSTSGGTFEVPNSTKRIDLLEITWAGDELPINQTFQWGGADVTSGSKFPWVPVTVGGAGLLGGAAIVGGALWKRAKREEEIGYAIEGVVADQFGNSLEGIEVTLTDSAGTAHQHTTDTEGKYVFSDLEPGRYKLTIDRPFFDYLEETIDVVEEVLVHG